jgi:ASC-1-like (ASCH) protein/GNAT superfamily N-acetyltransferase
MKHLWRIKKEYFLQLLSGDKSMEIRVGYNSIKKVEQGDTISFENYGKNEFNVLKTTVYSDFEEMLKSESVKEVLPGYSFAEALKILRNIYPADKERLGVYAFKLQAVVSREPKRIIVIASHCLKDNKSTFARIIADSYKLTDWICKDYPDHCKHFWTKYVPGIFTGEREIISCYVDNKIAGTIILKKEGQEHKICTLFVDDKFRGQKIATVLLEQAFKYLGTTKPLITIADYKIKLFENIIKKYDWQLAQTLDGIYNNHSKELVYNGKL